MEFTSSDSIDESIKSKQDNLPKKFYANERLSNNLSLRKRKINAVLSKQRGLEYFKKEGNKDYEVNKESLKIEESIKNKMYDDIDIFLKEMKKYIKSENIEYIKYALLCLRNQITNNDNYNNKINLSEEYQKKDFISDIIFLIQKYFDNKQIIFEGLWVFINVLYFLKDPSDLSLFLTKKDCVNLYIKILDKKDEVLRFHIYWLLSNILSNTNESITNEALFHLYMSPLFRLYLFKNLDDGVIRNEKESEAVFNIISRLSTFINYTYICLSTNNIQKFMNYNSEIDFNSIQENNNFLFYHSLKYCLLNIEIDKLKNSCVFGLSQLSNFLQDQQANKEFFKTGVVRKLVKEQIKFDDENICYVVQIIGNFLSYTNEELIDNIFLEEILMYYVKLIKNYPERQMLKRDIFWGLSNITSGNYTFCEKFAQSGLLELTLQSIYSDSEITVDEALYVLLGFFDSQNIELIVQYHNFDYIKCLTMCLNNIRGKLKPGSDNGNKEIIERIFVCIGFLFDNGELLKLNCRNKFVCDFEANGGFEILENILSENIFSHKNQQLGEQLLKYRNN